MAPTVAAWVEWAEWEALNMKWALIKNDLLFEIGYYLEYIIAFVLFAFLAWYLYV